MHRVPIWRCIMLSARAWWDSCELLKTWRQGLYGSDKQTDDSPSPYKFSHTLDFYIPVGHPLLAPLSHPCQTLILPPVFPHLSPLLVAALWLPTEVAVCTCPTSCLHSPQSERTYATACSTLFFDAHLLQACESVIVHLDFISFNVESS